MLYDSSFSMDDRYFRLLLKKSTIWFNSISGHKFNGDGMWTKSVGTIGQGHFRQAIQYDTILNKILAIQQ